MWTYPVVSSLVPHVFLQGLWASDSLFSPDDKSTSYPVGEIETKRRTGYYCLCPHLM